MPWVRDADVLLVDGGDATYLCHWMRESGLAELLPSLPETVWVGVSAGSMVMTPRIGDDFVEWPSAPDDRTIGVVDFSIFPHLGHEMMPENTLAEAERWAAEIGAPRTPSMTKRPSRWSTAPLRSSRRGIGSSSTRSGSVGRACRATARAPVRSPNHAAMSAQCPASGSTVGTPAGSRYRQRVDLATCPFDSTMLLVQDRRKGDERGPLVQCPSCERYFNFGSRGLEQVPAEPDRPP